MLPLQPSKDAIQPPPRQQQELLCATASAAAATAAAAAAARAARRSMLSIVGSRYCVYLLYWYKSTNTDAVWPLARATRASKKF
jgi:hypothetical protein